MSRKKLIIVIVIIVFILSLILLSVINNSEPFHYTKSIFFGKSSDKLVYSDEFTDIDTIYIDVDNAIVNLINRDYDNIKLEINSSRDNIKIKNYNKRLSIMTEDRKKCMFCKMNVINIYVNEDFKEYINIINDYGFTTLENFPEASVSISNKFGNVKVGNINMLKVIIGRGKLVTGKIGGTSIRINWGDVDISEVNDVFIDNKLTDISINKINNSINLENDVGNIAIENAYINKESDIENEIGDIIIKNLIDDNNYLEK